MAKRNSRRWIAVVLVGLGLLAGLAWWRWPHAVRNSRFFRAIASSTLPQPGIRLPDPVGSRRDARPMSKPHAPASQGDFVARVGACIRDYQKRMLIVRNRLDPTRSAGEAFDRLLLDGLLAPPDKPESEALWNEYQSASALWPKDPSLAWLAFDRCADNCDRDAQIRHLLRVDPDNAAAWMVAMSSARLADDKAGFGRALQRASTAKFYDSRGGVVYLRMRSLLAVETTPESCMLPAEVAQLRKVLGRDPTPGDLVDLMAGGMERATSAPWLPGAMSCDPQTVSLTRAQRGQCVALLSRVAQGDSLLEQNSATRRLMDLETDPGRLRDVRERYRQLHWLMKFTDPRPAPMDYYTRMMADGEVATLQAIAMQRHRWPPPRDWLPDDPGSRALITGGPPP